MTHAAMEKYGSREIVPVLSSTTTMVVVLAIAIMTFMLVEPVVTKTYPFLLTSTMIVPGIESQQATNHLLDCSGRLDWIVTLGRQPPTISQNELNKEDDMHPS